MPNLCKGVIINSSTFDGAGQLTFTSQSLILTYDSRSKRAAVLIRRGAMSAIKQVRIMIMLKRLALAAETISGFSRDSRKDSCAVDIPIGDSVSAHDILCWTFRLCSLRTRKNLRTDAEVFSDIFYVQKLLEDFARQFHLSIKYGQYDTSMTLVLADGTPLWVSSYLGFENGLSFKLRSFYRILCTKESRDTYFDMLGTGRTDEHDGVETIEYECDDCLTLEKRLTEIIASASRRSAAGKLQAGKSKGKKK